MIDKKLLERAVDKWGVEAQSEMIVEECAELILALQKIKRSGGYSKEIHDNLIEEIADVSIMIEQAKFIFGEEEINEAISFKMNRLENRLNGV